MITSERIAKLRAAGKWRDRDGDEKQLLVDYECLDFGEVVDVLMEALDEIERLRHVLLAIRDDTVSRISQELLRGI